MAKIKLLLVLATCLAPIAFWASVALGVDCNCETPQLAQCGEETQCGWRSGPQECTGTYGSYFGDFKGIACTMGPQGSYCKVDPGPCPSSQHHCRTCTCEYTCDYDEEEQLCTKGAAHLVGGDPVCSWAAEAYSLSCQMPEAGCPNNN